MTWRAAAAILASAGLLAPWWTAAPAGAGSGVGCAGNTCSVLLSNLIALKGDVGAAPGHVQLPVAPPPCLWQPVGDTTAGSTLIIQQFGSAVPGTAFGVFRSVQQARMLLKDKPVPPGTWWQLPVNPAASKAAQRQCTALPLFFFTPPGQAPPTPPVPLQTLADYAYNHMAIPAPRLTVNPAGHGYVNLATYVWGRTRPVSAATGRPDAYVVTATLGGETVSVWAQPAAKGGFSVGANGPGTPYSACGPGGSRYRVGHVPARRRRRHPARLRCPLAGPGGRGVGQRHRHLVGHLGSGRAQRPRAERAAAHPDDWADPALPGGGDPEHQRRLARATVLCGAPGPQPPGPQPPGPRTTGAANHRGLRPRGSADHGGPRTTGQSTRGPMNQRANQPEGR